MNREPFEQKIDLIKERTERLRQAVSGWPKKQHALFDEVLEGFSTILEELYRTKEELRESEGRYRNLFNTIDEGYCIIEMIFDAKGRPADYRFLEVNEAFEKQTGLHDAEGKLMRELAPGHESHWFEIYGKIALTGEPVRFVNEAKALNRWYDVYAYRVGRPEDQQVAILFNDISEYKPAEEALRKSQALLHAVMETTSDPVYVKDRQSRVLMCNPALEKVAGKPAAEIIGKTDSEYYEDPAVGQALRENDQRVMESGRSQTMEETAKTPDGYRIFLSSKAPYRNESGDIIGIIGISHDITERKQLEEAQRKSQRLFSTVFRVNPGATILSLLADGKCVDANEAYAKLTGYTRKELIGKTTLELNIWISAEERQRVVTELARKGHLENVELTLRRKNGEVINTIASGEVITLDGQQYILSFFFDITDRKRAEETLRKREESFRALSENSPDIIERFDEEIRHIYVNPLAAKLHGISAEALIGKTNQELGVPEHYCRFWRERIQKVFQTGQAIEEENEFPTTSGKRIYQSRLVPEKAKDGAVTSVLIVSRDVTDRKRAEEMLQEYQKVVESSQDMIAVVDRNYRYLIANKAFLKYRGVGREQIIGRSVSEILGKDAFEELIKKNLDTCLQGEVVQYEMKYTYPELGERDLSVSYFPIESPEGINRVASVIRDITELKRIEETLRESETRRRLNAQVLIAQENERKLIAREIHDGFGSQLATVKYKVETFLQQTDNNVTGRSVESLESVIPILQESILEARRIQMNLRPSILDDLGILPTMEWFCRTFEETYPKIKVEKEIIVEESDVPPSLKTMIYRTVQEAMNNIAKHSKADLAHLSLRKTEGKIELLVQDNGQGFDLREVVGSEGSMQGFGLVSMRERTELSGGSFSIDSTEGGGTTIRASWPLGIAG